MCFPFPEAVAEAELRNRLDEVNDVISDIVDRLIMWGNEYTGVLLRDTPTR
jgi:hypothetical protein